ncbi:MAG: helix-turn-helix transcriptional regulator [Gemmatimonadota bacterium]
MDLNAWKAQLRKRAAKLAVLALLHRDEMYGVQLLERLQAEGGLEISDGSIYPLLRRLQKDGKFRGRWVEEEEATHPRRYYSLTNAGRQMLLAMRAEWTAFEASMRRLLREEPVRATR